MMESQARRFQDKFGRDPRPEDPIFFDPDAEEPRPLGAGHDDAGDDRGAATSWSGDRCRSRAHRGVVRAGLCGHEGNGHLFSAGDILAWEAAVGRHADNVGDEGDIDGEDKLDKDLRLTRDP
ncbi:MAG: hypothetical protein M3143_05115 [Actinomycetota bacterium]|nr:hypothetical protein [Actinomycetota bacterium]